MGQMELWEDSIWVNGTIDTETGIPGENKEGEVPHFYTKEKIKVREGECILKKEGGTGKIHATFLVYDKDELLKVDSATPLLEERYTFDIPSGNELYLRVMVEGEKEDKDFTNGGSLLISNRGIKGDIIYGIDAKKNKREIGDFSFLDTTKKENLVEATNEVLDLTNQAMEKANQAFQFANDGKSILAAAIGNGATASMTWDQLAKKCYRISYERKETSNNAHCYFGLKFNRFSVIIVMGENFASGRSVFVRSTSFEHDFMTESGDLKSNVHIDLLNRMIDAYIEDTSSRKQAYYQCIQIGYD